MLKVKEASLEILVASNDQKIAELEEEMGKQVEQFSTKEAEIEVGICSRRGICSLSSRSPS